MIPLFSNNQFSMKPLQDGSRVDNRRPTVQVLLKADRGGAH